MTHFFKTTALVALMSATAAPAFADGHLDMATMTCAQYKALSADDQMKVATMAIAEIDDGANGESMTGSLTATADVGGSTTAGEATEGNTTSGVKSDGNEDNTTEVPMDQAALDAFNLECDRNLDTLVSEAAAGLDGTR